MACQSPPGVLSSLISRKAFHFSFFASRSCGPILGTDFLQKFKITVAPETSQLFFACAAATPTGDSLHLPSSSQHSAGRPTPLADADFPPLPTAGMRPTGEVVPVFYPG